MLKSIAKYIQLVVLELIKILLQLLELFHKQISIFFQHEHNSNEFNN